MSAGGEPVGGDGPEGASPRAVAASRHGYGMAYENFVAQVYGAAVALGKPTRQALLGFGLPPEDVDAGIAEMLARGFVVPTGEPDTYEVVAPRTAFNSYAAEVEHRLAIGRATLDEMELLWQRATGRVTGAATNADVQLLDGHGAIAERIAILVTGAQQRLWWAIDGSPVTRDLLSRAAEDESVLAVAEGIDSRVVFDTSLMEDEGAMRVLERWETQGHQVRVGNGVPFTSLLADRTILVDVSAYGEDGVGSFEARVPASARAVAKLLDEIYVLSTPFQPTKEALDAADGGQPPLDERDRRILSLLTIGASDHVIARQLGVSVRTVERRVRYVMEHLGAATRFQAGVMAVRRGWV